ncbi:Ankyrin repeat-containing protein [Artemisia annua]|uniref:Ankyrin repeat-containing protein n=1 Tax=Artemisia annua TaxID=35608 RepID=A0A2U1Q749_ARTAN|nr:Ankyrin repeat-containing protein [Artemisia annua]
MATIHHSNHPQTATKDSGFILALCFGSVPYPDRPSLLSWTLSRAAAKGTASSAIDAARDEGEKEIVEILEQGEEVLNASRRGDIMLLESLLEKDASVDFKDHTAAIKGYKDVVILLVEFGSSLE